MLDQHLTLWDLLALLGALLWPLGLLGFGGYEDGIGSAIIAAGCAVVVSSLASGFWLRRG